jgi:fido (protein-threonine AMPylation protein)
VPDWDEDSQQLRKNLEQVLRIIRQAAGQRATPTVAAAKNWHSRVMQGLAVPEPQFVGRFRGESGLENVEVRVDANPGVASAEVASELTKFEGKLQTIVAILDAALPHGQEPDADQLAAIIDLCAWAHSEWVRIHPFANGNGRTARLWANSLAMRYGLPPFVRLRPRPNSGYGQAGARGMKGDWKPTAVVFRQLLSEFLS